METLSRSLEEMSTPEISGVQPNAGQMRPLSRVEDPDTPPPDRPGRSNPRAAQYSLGRRMVVLERSASVMIHTLPAGVS